MRIVNLIENTIGAAGLTPEHGLSFYIETEKHRLLMDAGASELLVENAGRKNIDLSLVDMVILSHGHYDHGGGLPYFNRINDEAKIYMKKTALNDYYSYHDRYRYIGIDKAIGDYKNVVFSDDNTVIDEELELFSDICYYEPISNNNRKLKKYEKGEYIQDEFEHEQCLIIREKDKEILFSGCAHHGILNIIKSYVSEYGRAPNAVISGFHLKKKEGYDESDKEGFLKLAESLNEYDTLFYTMHCTDVLPYEIMKEVLGDKLFYLHCGDELII